MGTIQLLEGLSLYELDYVISKPLYKVRDDLLNRFIEYIKDHTTIQLTEHKVVLCSNAVSCFVLNTSHKYLKGVYSVPITLKEQNYSNTLVVNGRLTGRKVSYTYTKLLMKFLYQFEYIDMYIGGVKKYGFQDGKVVPLETESSYIVLLDKVKVVYSQIGDQTVKIRENVLLLRDKYKRTKSFTLNEELRGKRDYLQDYNNFSRSFDVTHNGNSYDVQMYKVYNINTIRGGRSYMGGSIQSLSSSQREELMINKKGCTSYDYDAFEVAILYTLCEEILDGDPYTVPLTGFDTKVARKLCKSALIIMINCKSTEEAKRAFNKVVKHDFDVEELYTKGLIPSKFIPTNIILEKLQEKHVKVSHMLFASTSCDLQYIGSLINDYIVSSFMQKHEVLCLQVHDAFIVQEEYDSLLYKLMFDAWNHVLGTRDNCNVTKEF